ncbi:MAG TPA: ISAs1 family transposase [Anaerolineae bacterium]|nr:ISAs1 family transposase [Anaerolineae bacterium]
MDEQPGTSIERHFADLQDPRVERTKRHKLLDIVVLAICGVICGADDWVSIQEFGEAKLEWFQGFLELPNGIPSHDTFGRVFGLLDPDQFQTCFTNWILSVSEVTKGQVIAIDGKTLRRSHDKTLGKGAIVMVSAWATANHLVLGQVKVDDKSNEIKAVPELLRALDISGCIVTTDAMGCQKEIATLVVEGKGDYVLALKDNHPLLSEDVQLLFDDLEESRFRAYDYDTEQTVDKDHGRLETRWCWTISDPAVLRGLRGSQEWDNLGCVAKVRARRTVDDKVTVEDRYFLSSLDGRAEQMLMATRSHWQVENSLHWVLDIAFREDESRVRKNNGAQNLATLRHIALNLLKQETTAKIGIKNKRLKAGWSEQYLLRVLAGLFH